MPSWDVRLDVRCYMTVEVEADTEAEAVLDAVPADAESPQEATGRDD